MNATAVAPGVMAVVVTFHPDPAALAALLAAVGPQVGQVVVVDNHSPRPPVVGERARLICLDQNQGIAAAQNAGITAALELRASAVLLLDQDSLPQTDMVATLQAAIRSATAAGLRVGAAGPLIVDPDGRSEGFVRFRDGRYKALMPAAGQSWIDCDLLIASGTLIPAAALRDIGTMAEALFIDKVDTEWSLRAAARGWQLIGVPAARLQHRLGLRLQRLWFFGWRQLAVHKPFRYYYMVRNGLLLRRLPHATAAWRRADLRQLLSLGLYFGLLAPGRLAAARMMIRGLRDGLRAQDGPLKD